MPRLLFLLALTLGASLAFSQEVPADTRLAELQTAGYYELVAQARELGLPATGGVGELRDRIAQSLGLVLPPEQAVTGKSLTVDSAREAGLVTVDAPGDGKLLRLSGGLHVTLVDHEKKVTHIIEAGELWYDQANEEMTARGQVVYTMVRETSQEVFRGESLTFRLSDSQGVFYGGSSDRSRAVADQTLTFRYQGDALRRSSEDLVVLDTGTITSSLGTDPYYRIQAKKIWVLAPGEWGLKDAVLYLGRVPVFYFPFFFQPGDDLFFNPVLSFPEAADRRGTSLQTTTYVWGKKKKDSAPLSFLQLEDSAQDTEKVQRGLFMVRGKAAPSSLVPANWLLKYQADFYSNLGFLTGVEASLPGLGALKTLNAFAGIGVTRTVGSDGLPFSVNPFDAALDPWDQSDWNGSWLGSTRLPFRWGGRFDTDSGWGNLALEYYSDPLLYNDLTGSRSEDFSIFSLLGLGPARKTALATSKSSLQWSGGLNWAPVTASGGLLWDSKTVTPAGPSGDPENTFYLPTQLTLPQLAINWGGTLWPPGKTEAKGQEKTLSLDLIPPESGVPELETNPALVVDVEEVTLVAPARLDPVVLGTLGQWTTGATWSLKPSVKVDTRFDTASARQPSDPLWDVSTSRWSGAYDGSLGLSAGRSDGTWTATQAFTLHQQAQDSWYLGPTVTSAQTTVYDLQDRQQTSGRLSQTLASTWKPFVGLGAWRDSNLQYNLTTKLWESTYLKDTYFDGTKDTVTAHQAAAQGIYYLLEGVPTIKTQAGFQSTLPPLDAVRTWSGLLDVSYPWGTANTKASVKQTKETWTFDPWETTAEWKPWSQVSLKETYQYDLENSRPLVSTTTAAAWGATVQYRHQRTTPYEFDTTSRSWVIAGDQDFLPQELRFSYTLDLPNYQWWYYRNTLSSKVNFAWPINLQQYSQMPLTLTYTVNYKLHRFLDLQVSEGIVNRTAYRYFPFLVDSFGSGTLKAVNPVTDLWDAVSIWDQAALRRTGFKMTNLSVALVHYLDDWQVKLDYSGAPQLNDAGTQYAWKGTLTLLVQWYPVPELKTQMQWDKEGTLTIAKNTS